MFLMTTVQSLEWPLRFLVLQSEIPSPPQRISENCWSKVQILSHRIRGFGCCYIYLSATSMLHSHWQPAPRNLSALQTQLQHVQLTDIDCQDCFSSPIASSTEPVTRCLCLTSASKTCRWACHQEQEERRPLHLASSHDWRQDDVLRVLHRPTIYLREKMEDQLFTKRDGLW